MERLGADHHVDRAVGHGEVLGTGLGGAYAGQRGRQHRQHLGVGVGRVHVVALLDEQGGQLAGARAELEDGAPGPPVSHCPASAG